MASVTLERRFDAAPDRVFAMISKTEHLIKWWGHENTTLTDHNLNFAQLGPWYSVLQNADGQTYKMSGQVTHVDEPNSVGFTWAWHDDNDKRGDETHVTIQLQDDGAGGTALKLTHVNFATQEGASQHESGWAVVLRRLENYAAANTETHDA